MTDSKNIRNGRENIDDFFKESLRDHRIEPSGNVWEKINIKFLNDFLKGSGNRNIYILFSGLIIVGLGISSIFVFTARNESPNEYLINPPAIVENADSKQITENTQTQTHSNKINESIIEGVKSKNDNERQVTDQSQEKVLHKDNSKIVIDSPEKELTINDQTPIPSTKENQLLNYQIFKLRFLSTKLLLHENNKSLISREVSYFRDITFKDDYAKKADASFNIHLIPGITYYHSRPNKGFYGLDFTTEMDYGNLSFEAGIGASYELDNGDYLVNYDSWDSVGFYYNITSFTVDPVNPDSVIFNKETVSVYDSIEHLDLRSTKRTYTYLQFPLAIKYKFLNYGKISFSVRGGCIFSVLLNKSEPELQHNIPQTEIIGIRQQTPSRRKTNWRVFAGIQFQYMLTNKIKINLEPVYMHHLKSPYVKGEYDMPKSYTIGLRTGISFNL